MSRPLQLTIQWKWYLLTGSLFLVSIFGLQACNKQTTAEANAQTPQTSSLTTDIPRLANGKPDFSGIWQSTSGADYDLE
ncbi:MAG TPA: hypothetical protein VIM59_06160, partial [Cellvibrio sp.]